MVHGCMFLGKMVDEDLLHVKTEKNEENGLGWYIKNTILAAATTS